MLRVLFIGYLLNFILIACINNDYSPKPRAYHRINFPNNTFSKATIPGCPFELEIPRYSEITDDYSNNSKPCWKNVTFNQFNAQLHLSYYPINPSATLNELTEDARAFVFKHTTKATSIDQQTINHPEHNVYGLAYNIQGNTASNFQFYVTDTLNHYIRGALYFNEKPNLDSIQPVLEFLKSDIQEIIRSVRWK